MTLRDAAELLAPAVAETLSKLDPGPDDAAVAKLAELYAQVIDELPAKAPRGYPNRAWGMRWIGPLLLECLVQLGATPAARAAIAKSAKSGKDKPKTQLDMLREQRTRRPHA